MTRNEDKIRLIAKVSVVIFIYILLFFFYKGSILKTFEGDSLNYHIPLANAFLNGTIPNPALIKAAPFLKYYPASSEGIISGLIFLKIPINVFNVLGVFFLFAASFFTAKKFSLKNDFSLIFAVTISSLHTIIRWINTQVIDIWLAGFFLISLALLQKPTKKISYFVFLGAAFGMLIGTKYTGIYFLFILLLFNFKKILRALNLKRFVAFLIPFTMLGLLWYLRNFLLLGNPIYPQGLLFFKGANNTMYANNVYKSLFYPDGAVNFLNAGLSEYFLWAFVLLIPLIFLYSKFRKSNKFRNAKILIAIGFLNLIVFFFLPSDRYYNIAVSVFRYTYPAFIPLILSVFLIAREYKKELFLSYFSLSCFIMVPEISFYPKLLFLFVPLALLVFYFEDVYVFLKNKGLVKGGK